ncbi:two-component sensor histidine kinase [Microvirga lupini]|uniref:histidine kinase n=1 Tax=Microvirga lupini TaxID=420324 RepID=A0A7W4YVV1_9HYPH|nr:histidine kinase dimerization/phosphoacceptor domain -containing protein [Microvirga lupini]MBB3017584.1 two-component sensor histidine kinase [Microvirga lupini]
MIPVRDMRSVLYATAILFAVAVIGIRGTFLWLEYRSALHRAEAATQDLALLMEEYAKRTLETSDLLLNDIIAYVRLRGGVGALSETTDASQYLAGLTQRSSASDLFLIIDKDGSTVGISTLQPNAAVNFADRSWFKAHRAGAETFVGGAVFGRIAQEVIYTYSRRIPDLNGDFDGVAQIALRPAFLQEVSRSDSNTGNVILGMWGRDGRVIARTGLTPNQTDSGVSHTALFNEMEGQRSGTYRANDMGDGIDRIISFRRLDRWPVTVTASVPVATALAAWTTGFYWSAGITGLVLIALCWLTWIGVRLSHQTETTQSELRQANENLGTALSDKVMLLQEIHHRVKNNLQVTSSLLQMQARRFPDPGVKAAFQETQDRLRSIGLIHDILYRKDTGGTINLQDYLGRLIPELSATYGAVARGISVDLDAEPLMIDLDRGAPLALAVTEAISNAFKHAFGPGEGGRILVSARRIDGRIEIIVRDTGRGLSVAPESDSSLGMKLIRSFAQQLGGRFSLTADDGTVFPLDIPA